MTFPAPPVAKPLHQALAGYRFVKVTSPAGDWIVFSHDFAVTMTKDQIIGLSDRRHGVGATGVVVMSPTSEKPQHTTTQHHLAAWRADGSIVEDLTEAARAATSAMAALGTIDAHETSHHVFQSGTELVTTVYTPAHVGVDIGQWSLAFPETAQTAGSDALVMTAGLTDPRPGLSIQIHHNHIVIAVETLEELETIDLNQQPSIEPAVEESTGICFVVPQEPVIDNGMGHLMLRHSSVAEDNQDLASAAAATAVAFQQWSGLQQLTLWTVRTPLGEIVVQLHDQHRLSTFTKASAVFFGRF